MGGGEVEGVYVHHIDKQRAESLLAHSSDGTFLFRKSGSGTILSVVYRSRPTHHLCTKVDGEYLINKQKICDGASTLNEVVSQLGTARAKWPVPLTDMIHPLTEEPQLEKPPPADEGSNDADTDSKKVVESGTSDNSMSNAETPQAAPVAVDASSQNSSEAQHDQASLGDAAYLHPIMPKEAAEALLRQSKTCGEGTFLFFQLREGRVVLAVIYKNKATYHSIQKLESGVIKVNLSECDGCTTYGQVVQHLQTTRPWWPVPLIDAVLPAPAAPETPQEPQGSASNTGNLVDKSHSAAKEQEQPVTEKDDAVAQAQAQERRSSMASNNTGLMQRDPLLSKLARGGPISGTSHQAEIDAALFEREQKQRAVLHSTSQGRATKATLVVSTLFADVMPAEGSALADEQVRVLVQRSRAVVDKWQQEEAEETDGRPLDDKHLLKLALRSLAASRSPLGERSDMLQRHISFQTLDKLVADMRRLRSDYALAVQSEEAQRQREAELKKKMADMMKPVKFSRSQLSVKKK